VLVTVAEKVLEDAIRLWEMLVIKLLACAMLTNRLDYVAMIEVVMCIMVIEVSFMMEAMSKLSLVRQCKRTEVYQA
jgi:hypothetical protein